MLYNNPSVGILTAAPGNSCENLHNKIYYSNHNIANRPSYYFNFFNLCELTYL